MNFLPAPSDAQSVDSLALNQTQPPLPTLATILLVEPEAGRASSRTMFLQAAQYAVISVTTALELQTISKSLFISIVIVSEDLARASLRRITESSRRKWPLARILILGRAQRLLEDNLYDESIEEPFKPTQLLDALRVLLLDSWKQPVPAVRPSLQESERPSAGAAPHLIVPAESDPTKIVEVEIVRQSSTWDTPARERSQL